MIINTVSYNSVISLGLSKALLTKDNVEIVNSFADYGAFLNEKDEAKRNEFDYMIIDAVYLDKQLVGSFIYHINEIFTNRNFIIIMDANDTELTWQLKDNNVQYMPFSKEMSDLMALLP